MLEIEMNDVRGEQSPPLAGCECGSLVAQGFAPRVAGERRQQKQCGRSEESQPSRAVAIERREQPPNPVHRPSRTHLL